MPEYNLCQHCQFSGRCDKPVRELYYVRHDCFDFASDGGLE